MIHKTVLLGLATFNMALILSASTAFAQETSAPVPPGSSASDSSAHSHHKHWKHHGKKGFFLGMCVGQMVLNATPPIVIPNPQMATMTKDQRKALRKAQEPIIEAAKEKCKAEFKAAHGSSGGGSSSATQE